MRRNNKKPKCELQKSRIISDTEWYIGFTYFPAKF